MGQLASLEPWLEEVVLQGVVSVAEAWGIQDARNLVMVDPDDEVAVPLCSALWPAAERIWLYEVTQGERAH